MSNIIEKEILAAVEMKGISFDFLKNIKIRDFIKLSKIGNVFSKLLRTSKGNISIPKSLIGAVLVTAVSSFVYLVKKKKKVSKEDIKKIAKTAVKKADKKIQVSAGYLYAKTENKKSIKNIVSTIKGMYKKIFKKSIICFCTFVAWDTTFLFLTL